MSKLSTRNRARSSQGETRSFEGMSTVNVFAAGVDIGAHAIMACVVSKDAWVQCKPSVTTAHKMARTVYHMRKDRLPYHDIGAGEYNQRFRERELKYLQKKAAKLGYTLSLASPSTP